MDRIAEMIFHPGGIIVWLIVGLIVGWLAARVMKGGNYHAISNVIAGMVGAVIGGAVLVLVMKGEAAFWGSMLGAILGAHLLIALFRFLGFGRSGT